MLAIILSAAVAQPVADAPAQRSPADEVLAALADARRLPPDQCRQTRYLSLYAIAPERRADYAKVLAYHVNTLSREAEAVRPRRVTESLYAVECDAYGWVLTTFGGLHEFDPWFHARAIAGGKEIIVHGPWLPAKEIAELTTLTGSVVPIVRADWFVHQTGQQPAKGPGYYDFLAAKKLADVEEVAGLDRKVAQRVRREIAAVVAESGVTLQNRQIFRFGTVAGAWWESRDVAESTGPKNAVRNLDGDFKHDATEVFFTLPNGLWGLAVANAKGELQASAPDNIAGDHESTNNDRRVRVGISCVRCHREDGLRPIDDYSRKAFRVGGAVGLGSPDRERARRLKQLYLGPLQKEIAGDRAKYAEVLKELTGLTSEKFVPLYAAAWRDYESPTLMPADVARWVGVSEKELIQSIRWGLRTQGLTDLALAGIVADPPLPLRREHVEELTPVLMTLVHKEKP